MDKLKLSDDVMPNSKYKRDRRNAMLETVSSKESSAWSSASDLIPWELENSRIADVLKMELLR